MCRHHWQMAILEERRRRRRRQPGALRLRIYKQWHPDGATEQCKGKTWW